MANLEMTWFKQILLTGSMVLVGGVFVFWSLFGGQNLLTTSASVSSGSEQRAPASAPDIEVTPSAALPKVDSLLKQDLCKNQNISELQSGLDHIQLKGNLCLGAKKIREIQITNQSNGHVATVFVFDETKYQTDVLPLSSGLNDIQARVIYMDGKSEEIAFVIRR